MRSVVLVDTGPLYAAADPDDSHHRRSKEEQQRLSAEGLMTAISFATLQETHRLILRKLGIAEGHSFLRGIGNTAIFINPIVQDYEWASARVLRYAGQDISLADAICAELSERLTLPVWTYDHHFDVMRVSVWR